MLGEIDLRELAEMSGPERAFVSLYISGPEALGSLANREERVRALLSDDEVESEHFSESMRMLRETLDEHRPEGPMAVFASWALDLVVGYRLPVAPPDLLWVDSSPYIRPIAEIQDENERFAVVFADNRAAEVYLAGSDDLLEAGGRIRGDVKNHVKKGGWSQKRYQRRRSNEILHYAKEVAQRLEKLVSGSEVDRVVLIGSEEACRAIREAVPESLDGAIVATVHDDLSKDTQVLMTEAIEATREREREDERELWKWLRNEGLKEGLAAFGPRDTLAACKEGRVDVLFVDRELELEGMRCRDCEILAYAKPQQCPSCRSTSVFSVDLVNEMVELAALSGARTEFTDPIPALTEVGGIAAALRWAANGDTERQAGAA